MGQLRLATLLGAATLITGAAAAQNVKSLVLSQSEVIGGNTISGTVTLDSAATKIGTYVTITDTSTWITTPMLVHIPMGAKSATFTISTFPVANFYTRLIYATSGGTKAAFLTLQPAAYAITVEPGTIKGGESAVGTVRLAVPAPTGGVVIQLWDDSSALQVPASVTIPAGETRITFPIQSVRVSQSYARRIFAQFLVDKKNANITITP